MPIETLSKLIQEKQTQNPDQKFSPKDVPADLRKKLLEQFLADHPAWKVASKNHDKAVRQLNSAKGAAGALKVTVLKERAEPRKTHVLVRGEWDKHGDEVGRGVPSIFKQDDAGPLLRVLNSASGLLPEITLDGRSLSTISGNCSLEQVCAYTRRFRHAGRNVDASRVAGLAGG